MSNDPWRNCPTCSEAPINKKGTVPPSGKVVACQSCHAVINTDTGEILTKDRTIEVPFLKRFVDNLNGNDLEALEKLISEKRRNAKA